MTAVEWLIDQLRGTDEKGDFIFNGVITSELIEQAKQMEAEQEQLRIAAVSKSFYCQQGMGIGGKDCETQCEHCKGN